jgi:hypothetical protein
VAVVGQYAMSVSFAHSLPCFSCGRRRPFSDVGASRGQAVCMAKPGSAVSGILVLYSATAQGSAWRGRFKQEEADGDITI